MAHLDSLMKSIQRTKIGISYLVFQIVILGSTSRAPYQALAINEMRKDFVRSNVYLFFTIFNILFIIGMYQIYSI